MRIAKPMFNSLYQLITNVCRNGFQTETERRDKWSATGNLRAWSEISPISEMKLIIPFVQSWRVKIGKSYRTDYTRKARAQGVCNQLSVSANLYLCDSKQFRNAFLPYIQTKSLRSADNYTLIQAINLHVCKENLIFQSGRGVVFEVFIITQQEVENMTLH